MNPFRIIRSFSCHVSSLLQTETGPQTHLDFHDLHTFEDYSQLFYRMSLNLGLSDVSSGLDSGYTVLAETP